MPPNPPSPTFYSFATAWAPIFIALIALGFSYSANKNSTDNKRHWRREKIYTLADEICEIATDYWLTQEDDIQNKRRALSIKYRIVDIESNAEVIGLDIADLIAKMNNHATGGLFETSGRKALGTDNEKFYHLRFYSQRIKEELQKS